MTGDELRDLITGVRIIETMLDENGLIFGPPCDVVDTRTAELEVGWLGERIAGPFDHRADAEKARWDWLAEQLDRLHGY